MFIVGGWSDTRAEGLLSVGYLLLPGCTAGPVSLEAWGAQSWTQPRDRPEEGRGPSALHSRQRTGWMGRERWKRSKDSEFIECFLCARYHVSASLLIFNPI